GSAVPVAPAVKVTDAQGGAVSGVAVTFAVTGGGGSITGASQSSNSSGVATVGSWTLGPAAGPNTLTATSSGLSGSPVTFMATGTTSTTGLQAQDIYTDRNWSCAVTAAGVAYCWGGSPIPVAVPGGITFKSLSLGDSYICGLTAAGVGYCWGDNGAGQLGD